VPDQPIVLLRFAIANDQLRPVDGAHRHRSGSLSTPAPGRLEPGRTDVDHKDQWYNPHGSVSNVDARSGYIFRIVMNHIDTKGKESVSAPDAGCLIP
jgi:hypothetical protein